MNLLVYYGHRPSTMDAVLAIVFDSGQAIRQKHEWPKNLIRYLVIKCDRVLDTHLAEEVFYIGSN
jgi:hypothetical protein